MKKPYCCVLQKDGKDFEWFGEVDMDERWGDPVGRLADECVRKAGLTTPRSQPVAVLVTIFEILIKNGQQMRRIAGTRNVTPQLSAMTNEEYEAEKTELLADVPVEFHTALGMMAWDNGHSAGLEEVISSMGNLISQLLPSIKDYRKQLLSRQL